MTDQHVLDVINDPLSQRLINSIIPARLAYNGADGFPRVIPVGFHWDGAQFLVGSPDNAPKVKALQERPQVALTIDTEGMPPNVLLVRGVATVEVVDGVHDAFLDASRKRVSPEGLARIRGRHSRSVQEDGADRDHAAVGESDGLRNALPAAGGAAGQGSDDSGGSLAAGETSEGGPTCTSSPWTRASAGRGTCS